jgi:hypothetical protein
LHKIAYAVACALTTGVQLVKNLGDLLRQAVDSVR